MAGKLLVRDLTLRDGQQSQFATRMTQAQVDRVLPFYRDAGFYAMEVWGGAVPDSVMRYLNENPWDRLEKIKTTMGNVSKLTALSRGRNLFGYNPYPDDVIEGFCRNAVQSGIDIMRIFDALNDIDNMTATIKFVKQNNGVADCAVCYTTDARFSFGERFKAFFSGKKLPGTIFTVDYFVAKAKQLEQCGADMITIKDMAGLIQPEISARLIRNLKKELRIPVNLHTHCTPGFGLASILMAMINGVDIVDTVILNFSGGPAAPAFELMQIFAHKLNIETGVCLEPVVKINKELRLIRKELAAYDEYKEYFPLEFNIIEDKLPPHIDGLFDRAIDMAQKENIPELLAACHKIDAYFNFPKPDDAVKKAQIPGGMYTNMMAQMKQAKLEHLFDRVLEIVPQVRVDAGCPPLVTPTSQIVGVQAVNCVVDEAKGKPFYTNKSTNFVNLVKGSYGKTPFPVDPAFRLQIAGIADETPYDTSKHVREPNPRLEDCGGLLLAKNEKEELLLELFPNVANTFLKKIREQEFQAMPKAVEPEEPESPLELVWASLHQYAG